MGSPTTIHPFPELMSLAEEEARAFAAAGERACDADWLAWERLDQMTRERRITSHLTLLCDLTRPMSRYAVSVLVGNRIGWDGHSIALSVETGGINIHALFRDCGFKAEPSLNAGADLALIVRHLWPEESP